MFDVKTRWATYKDCYVTVDKYRATGATAIQIWNETEGPIATLTVCLPQYVRMDGDDRYTFLDTNNFPEGEDVVVENGLGEMTGDFGFSGYCAYPVVKLNMDAVNAHVRGGV